MKSSTTSISDIKTYEERYPDGVIRLRYNAGIADDGRYLLHGTKSKTIWRNFTCEGNIP